MSSPTDELGSALEEKSNSVTRHTNTFGSARKGAKQWQEDSFFHFSSANKKVVVGGVFDGHGGYNGLLASNCARDTSLAYFTEHTETCENWKEYEWTERLKALFFTLHQEIRERFLSVSSDRDTAGGKRYVDEKGIVRSSSGDPIHGGTTGSVSVLVKNADGSSTVITANVGDSTALLIPSRGKGDFSFLTVDHGPESQEEFLRLRALDSKKHPCKLLYVYDKTNVYRKYECPQVFFEDGTKNPDFVENPWGNGLHPTNVRYEPAVYAVTPKSVTRDSTCIAMTRALGDFYAHQFGLSCEPSVGVEHLAANKSYTVCIGSDGVWDCWRYEDFASYLGGRLEKERETVSEAVETSLNESIKRAVANFGAKHYDDASMVLIHCLAAN